MNPTDLQSPSQRPYTDSVAVPPEALAVDPPAGTLDPGPYYAPLHNSRRDGPDWDWFSRGLFPDRGVHKPGLAALTAEFFEASGWWVFPVAPPDDRGAKRPLLPGWGDTRLNRDALRRVYRRHPGAGVGLLIGHRGGLVDIDIDDPDYAWPVLRRMFPQGIPKTLGWETSDGKFHLLFRYDPQLAKYNRSKYWGKFLPSPTKVLGDPNYFGVEIKIGSPPGDRGSHGTTIPPSRLADGRVRRWIGGPGIWPLPSSVIQDLDCWACGGCAPTPHDDQKERVQRPNRSRRSRMSVRDRAVRYLATIEPSIQGMPGSNTCFKAACFIGPGFDLSQDSTFNILWTYYNPRCEPPWTEQELKHKVEDAYKVRSDRGWLL